MSKSAGVRAGPAYTPVNLILAHFIRLLVRVLALRSPPVRVDEGMAQLVWAQVREHSQAVLALHHYKQDALTIIEAADFALRSSIESPSAHPATPVPSRNIVIRPTRFLRPRSLPA